MLKPCAGLIFDDSVHYIDHLAPFCALMQWPLIVFENSIAEQCAQFYPMTEVIQTDFSFQQLPECIVSCDNRPLLTLALGPFSKWKGRFIWLPHGQSDKGWKSSYFEALGKEDLLLIYGERMRGTLRSKNITLPQVSVGNFRWQFYQTNRSFYNYLMNKTFGKGRFILYAPTWDDCEQNSSFWKAYEQLIATVPGKLHLCIKVHPNMQKKSFAKLEQCRGKLKDRQNISFIDDFPPIYPLLERTDVYIGDMSSIGYDFLRFDRPLFFLTDQKKDPTKSESAWLMQYGEQILYEEIPKLFSRFNLAHPRQLEKVFDETDPITIRQEIDQWLQKWK